MLCCVAVEFLPIGSDCREVFAFDAFDKINLAAHSAKGSRNIDRCGARSRSVCWRSLRRQSRWLRSSASRLSCNRPSGSPCIGKGLVGNRSNRGRSGHLSNSRALTGNPSISRGLTGNPTNKKRRSDNLSSGKGLTGHRSNSRGLTGNPSNKNRRSDNLSSSKGRTGNQSNSRALTGNPSNGKGLTGNLSSSKGRTGNPSNRMRPSGRRRTSRWPMSGRRSNF